MSPESIDALVQYAGIVAIVVIVAIVMLFVFGQIGGV